MQNFTTLQILIQEVLQAENAAERRCDTRAAEDYILAFAAQISAKRAALAALPPPQENIPTLTATANQVTVTLIRDGRERIRTFPLKSFFIYKTNEKGSVTPHPGKDGYTWFMRNYSLAPNGEVEAYGETLEPYEGPILYELLKEAKR